MLRPDNNPSEDKRTPADRLSDAPKLLWWMLAFVAVAVFVGVVFLIWNGRGAS